MTPPPPQVRISAPMPLPKRAHVVDPSSSPPGHRIVSQSATVRYPYASGILPSPELATVRTDWELEGKRHHQARKTRSREEVAGGSQQQARGVAFVVTDYEDPLDAAQGKRIGRNADERLKMGRRMISTYTSEHVRQLARQEDGALSVWMDHLATTPPNSSLTSLERFRNSPESGPTPLTPPLVPDDSTTLSSPRSPPLATPPPPVPFDTLFPSRSPASSSGRGAVATELADGDDRRPSSTNDARFRSRFSVDPPSVHEASCCGSSTGSASSSPRKKLVSAVLQPSRWKVGRRDPARRERNQADREEAHGLDFGSNGLGLVISASSGPRHPPPPHDASNTKTATTLPRVQSEWLLVDPSTPTRSYGRAQKHAPPLVEPSAVKRWIAPSPKVEARKGYRGKRVPKVPPRDGGPAS